MDLRDEIEEEIARTLAEWRSGEHAEPWEVEMYSDAAELLMPLVRKAQAEAWEQGFDAHEADWLHHKDSGWGDEDCLDGTYNPYIEQNSEGNETP